MEYTWDIQKSLDEMWEEFSNENSKVKGGTSFVSRGGRGDDNRERFFLHLSFEEDMKAYLPTFYKDNSPFIVDGPEAMKKFAFFVQVMNWTNAWDSKEDFGKYILRGLKFIAIAWQLRIPE